MNKFGFKLVDQHTIKDINSEAFVYEHEKSGARLLHLKNDDDNKVFSVAFRTPPTDSTGVPHIIEHCVLSGSRKYKTKEPFMDMVKGSLKTFINAMTFSDKTIYPVASRNEKDFTNLMDVYLDSVFFPMIHEEKEIFMQEGWHHSIENLEDPLKFNGVVYNEMRGAYSQPTTVLRENIGRSLYPNTTYQHSSGGNPEEITNLSFEDFKQFHVDHYHPSNSYIYVYGNGDIDKYMAHMDKDYLCHFDKKTVNTTIEKQTAFEEVNYVNSTYGIAADENEENKTFLSMNFVVGDGTDKRAHFVGEIVKDALVNAAAGPIKKALLDAGIGQDIMCSFDGGLQMNLSIIAKNANADQKDAFEKNVMDTLKNLVKDGIDKDLLESAINISEYDMREATGFATKGIIYHILSMNTWLYEGHPTELISYDETINELRELAKTDFFEKFLEDKLINNTHASVITLVPEKGLGEKNSKADEKKLAAFKDTLSEDVLKQMIAENESLKKKQLSPDSEEALATIPKLAVSDVDQKAELLPIELFKKDGYEIIKHDIFSNDIAYVEFLFDTTMVKQEDVQYIPLLADLIGKLDTTHMDYGTLNNEIYKLTGGISLSSRTYTDTKSDAFFPKLILSGKAVSNKLSELFRLMNVLLKETKFEDTKRLKEILLQNKSRMEMSINNRGDNYAASRLASYFLPSSHYGELLKGFEYYWFLDRVIKQTEEDAQVVLTKLTDLYKVIFNQNNLKVSFTGDDTAFNEFNTSHSDAIKNINTDVFESQTYKFDLTVKNEGIASSSNVQYVARGFNFKAMGYEYTGQMQVLKSILSSEYLHDRIRAKGGAYGCGISFSDNGNVLATSYRDPNLEATLTVFEEMADYIDELSLDQKALTKFVIGAVSRLDGAMTARGKGTLSSANYISGINQEMIQQDRDEILNVTVDELKSLSKVVRDIMDKGYFCVYGNDVKIKENKDLFKSIVMLNK